MPRRQILPGIAPPGTTSQSMAESSALPPFERASLACRSIVLDLAVLSGGINVEPRAVLILANAAGGDSSPATAGVWLRLQPMAGHESTWSRSECNRALPSAKSYLDIPSVPEPASCVVIASAA